jgi:hypothetical protein
MPMGYARDPKFYEINWKRITPFAVVIFGSNSLTLLQLSLTAQNLSVAAVIAYLFKLTGERGRAKKDDSEKRK